MTASARVRVTDHSFGIFDGDQLPIETADWSNGLIVLMSAGATIYTGIHTGHVHVTAEALAQAPGHVDDQPWDDIIEASVAAPAGDLRIQSLEYGTVAGLPPLSPHGPGSYRVRAHVRGRDEFYDSIQNEPTEFYLLLAWPAGPAPAAILRASDRTGAELRGSQAQQTSQPNPATDPHLDTEHRARLRTAILGDSSSGQDPADHRPGDAMTEPPAAIVQALAAASLLTACAAGPGDSHTATPTAQESTGAIAAAAPARAGAPDLRTAPETQAAATVQQFATAWARRDLDAAQWQNEIAALSARRLGTLLRATSPATVPARQVTGTPQLVQRAPDQITYSVTTDAGTLTITVLAEAGTWKASAVRFQQSGDPSGQEPHAKPPQ
jgi:hypothetical protein